MVGRKERGVRLCDYRRRDEPLPPGAEVGGDRPDQRSAQVRNPDKAMLPEVVRCDCLRGATQASIEGWCFTCLYRSQAPRISRWFIRRGLGPEDAADLSQEAFVRLLAARQASRVERPGPYLYRIARNLYVDHLSSVELRRRAPVAYVHRAAQPPCPHAILEGAEVLRLVRAAIGMLPSGQRRVMTGYLQGVDTGTLAQQAGVRAATVHVQLHRARERIRRALRAPEAD